MKPRIFANSMVLLMCAAGLFFGGIMIFLGIEQLNEVKSRPDSFDTVPGFLYDYEVIKETADGTVYQLEYAYYVGGAEYKLYTQSTSRTPPQLNQKVSIMCDLYNPENASLAYKETYPMLILAGVLMALVPLIFLISALVHSGVVSFSRIELIPLVMGLVFAGFAFLSNYVLSGSFSFISTARTKGAAVLFPIVFLAAGIFLVVKGIFPKTEDMEKEPQ